MKNRLIQKLWLVSNFMRSHTVQQMTIIHILLNISRSKGNQTIEFGQLIDYDMRNIFLEISYAKCAGKASLRLFHIKSKLSISLEQQSEMI